MSLNVPGGGVQPSIADGGHKPEQSGQCLSLATDPELLALIERAKSHVMTPEELHEQRRSFVRGMCPSHRDYVSWCAEVDKVIPPLNTPSPSSTSATATETDGGETFRERKELSKTGQEVSRENKAG